MINTSNLKDTVTTICGIIVAIGGSLLGAGIELPVQVKSVLGVLMAISLGLIGWFTGKSPSGADKTDKQIVEQNKLNP